MTASTVHRKLVAAGVPIVGVSIGRVQDKSTWRVDFAPEATQADRDTAGKVLTALDLNAPDVPPQMSRLQAKLALKAAGKLGAVKAYVASLPADDPAVLAWQDAQVFRRDSGLLVSAAQAMGMTDAQIDALFIAGAQIEV